MGKYCRIGFFHGTKSGNQLSFENQETDSVVDDIYKKYKELFMKKWAGHNDELSVEDLEKVVPPLKFNRKDVLFVTKDKSGQLIWLEKGNEFAGMKHIVANHYNDFKNKLNVSKRDLPSVIKNIISDGEIQIQKVTIKRGKKGYEKIYKYKGEYYFVGAIGLNGFIISVYPIGKKTRKYKEMKKWKKK